MPTLQEIDEMGIDNFVESVLSTDTGINRPFNDDINFEKQLERFDKFIIKDDDCKAIIEDAKIFK